jgi:hypothetical protein
MKYQLKPGADLREMRGEVIEVHSSDLPELKAIFEQSSEEVAPNKYWLWLWMKEKVAAYYHNFKAVNAKEWDTCSLADRTPTITFQDFITKYFEPCTTK